MKRVVFLAAAIAALASMSAEADVASGLPTYSWTLPTTWSDGSALTAAQITGWQLECTGAAAVSRRIAAGAGVPPSLTAAANRLTPGSYNCTLATFARKTPTDPEDRGVPSNTVSFTVPRPTPGAPTGFSAD